MASKGHLYHSVIKGRPLAMLLLPWKMSAALAAIVSFFLLYYSGKGEGKRSRWKAEKKGSEGRKANSSLDFLKTFIAATSCPLSSLLLHCRMKIACKCEVKKGKPGDRKALLSLCLHLSSSPGTPHCSLLCFTALHRGCIFFTN